MKIYILYSAYPYEHGFNIFDVYKDKQKAERKQKELKKLRNPTGDKNDEQIAIIERELI